MALITPLLGEIEHESKATLKCLERVPAGKLDWSPHAKSMTLGRLAWHIASIPSIAKDWMEAGTIERGSARSGEIPGDPAVIAQTFRRNVDTLRAYLADIDDSTLKEPFTMTRGGVVVTSFPKIAMLRQVLMNHSYHHRGQLTVYLRILDVPLPAIYGSSADETM